MLVTDHYSKSIKVSTKEKNSDAQHPRNIFIHQVSHAALVPSTVLFLAKSPLVEQFDLSCLKDITSGAAPLSVDLSKALKERLPSIEWFRQGECIVCRLPCAVPSSLIYRENFLKYMRSVITNFTKSNFGVTWSSFRH